MKFSEMPYQRPDLDAVKQQFADLCARLGVAFGGLDLRAVQGRRKLRRGARGIP